MNNVAMPTSWKNCFIYFVLPNNVKCLWFQMWNTTNGNYLKYKVNNMVNVWKYKFPVIIFPSMQCLYCEKTFRDKTTLKDHMRKKQHRRINARNHDYDRFYVINYLVCPCIILNHEYYILLCNIILCITTICVIIFIYLFYYNKCVIIILYLFIHFISLYFIKYYLFILLFITLWLSSYS